jgi:hypothetical protein
VKNFWTFLYIVLFGSLIVLFIKNPKSFATVSGSLFTGLNGISSNLTGENTKAGT